MAKRQHLIFGERCNLNLVFPSDDIDESLSSNSRILVLFVLESLVASMKWQIAVTESNTSSASMESLQPQARKVRLINSACAGLECDRGIPKSPPPFTAMPQMDP